ncbi:MAG TPA: 2-hydroxychromene-2-carboxylate isomerase [Burkholderiales bacterium]|nr:2-hydroxychromene-2-carboxylate isomerase [Burkholderiales bacterium]
MMSNPIEFYFDFSSPYGYIASEKIDALAAKYGREVSWRPFLLGVAFKTTGGAPLPSIPMKGAYHLRDILRTTKYFGVEYRHPSVFPISSVSPCRAFYWLDAKDPKRARGLAKALYHAYFLDNIDISSADNTIAVCAKFGLKADEVRAGIGDQAIKDRTRAEVEKAIARGAFGSPYIVVDGEPFWGSDRLDQIDKWLATGGW